MKYTEFKLQIGRTLRLVEAGTEVKVYNGIRVNGVYQYLLKGTYSKTKASELRSALVISGAKELKG